MTETRINWTLIKESDRDPEKVLKTIGCLAGVSERTVRRQARKILKDPQHPFFEPLLNRYLDVLK